MGMLSAFAGSPARQVSILYRAPSRALDAALPAGLEPVEREGWVLLELACATPIELPLAGDVALIAWRTPVRLEDGSQGLWVLDRWSSARLGAGWPERWSNAAPSQRRSQWCDEPNGDLRVEVRSGPRRVALRASPTPSLERSLFVTVRQAESFLAGCGPVVNPHAFSWLIDRTLLGRGHVGLGPLTVHSLEVTAPDGISDRRELELDCAFRVVDRRRDGAPERDTAAARGATSPAAPAFAVRTPR